MNVFDIIGPVMVGPSSSHTAGAARIGGIARALLGEQPDQAVIKLHGSFAKTYRGHGTDKALIGGLLGMKPDDGRIRESMELARQQGMKFSFETVELKDAHPNSVLIEASTKAGRKVSILGASVGGGNIVVKKINGLDVEFTGKSTTLVIPHQDVPGVIASVAGILADRDINIANMKVFRSHRGGDAVMVIETDQKISCGLGDVIGHEPNIQEISVIPPV